MKTAILASLVASAAAFAPSQNGKFVRSLDDVNVGIYLEKGGGNKFGSSILDGWMQPFTSRAGPTRNYVLSRAWSLVSTCLHKLFR